MQYVKPILGFEKKLDEWNKAVKKKVEEMEPEETSEAKSYAYAVRKTMKKPTRKQAHSKALKEAKLLGVTGDRLRSSLRSIYSSLLRKWNL